MEKEQGNRRILVIDDNVAIHDDFRKILERSLDTSLLQEVRAELFDDVEEQTIVEKFEVETADQGQMGYRMVQDAMKAELLVCGCLCGYAHASRLGWRRDCGASLGRRS